MDTKDPNLQEDGFFPEEQKPEQVSAEALPEERPASLEASDPLAKPDSIPEEAAAEASQMPELELTTEAPDSEMPVFQEIAPEFQEEEPLLIQELAFEDSALSEQEAAVFPQEPSIFAPLFPEALSPLEPPVEAAPADEAPPSGAEEEPLLFEELPLDASAAQILFPTEETPEPENPSQTSEEDSEPTQLLPDPPEEEPADQEYRDEGSDFQEIFEAEAPKPKAPARRRPIKKGRPRRKTGEGLFGIPNILATFVWLALILAIGVTAGRMLWVCAADVLAFGRENKPVTITIYEADDMASITDKLYNAGLIRYKGLFNLYASISNAEEDIKPGIYDLNTMYDYHALVNFMSPRSSREVIELTIPEGYTCRQIFALLEENRVCTAVDIAAYAANGELDDYWFLEGVQRGSEYCLEGFLFPDTYEFYKNSTPREALQRMLNNFEIKFTEEMRAQMETLNANVTGGGYTVQEIAIVASLIERESASPEESDEIAGVIYNRLFRWEFPAYLNIDAAIVYAQGGEAETIDTSLDSPYNTYTHIGLTPGPIANPGLASLQAALNPAQHDYYYYVLNPATGRHQFSTTEEEHNAYITQFYGN